MVAVNKIDSNVVGLSYAEEASLKTLPGSPVWYALDPNSFSDFGGQLRLLARDPINASRQRKKGVIADLDAAGGFNDDLTISNIQDLFQGFFFADFRRKAEELVTAVDIDGANPDEYEVADSTGFVANQLIKGVGFANAANNALNLVTAVTAGTVEVATGQLVAEPSPPSGAKITVVGRQAASGDIDVDATGDLPAITSSALDLTTLGVKVGEPVFLGGDAAGLRFANAVNNGFKRARTITANRMEFDKSDSPMVNETGTGLTIQIFVGRVIQNETGALIKRRSYQLERTLGAPDDASPSQIQSEYITGAIPNQLTVNVPQADKVTCDLAFVGLDHEQRSGATGVKAGDRIPITEQDAFNTSSNVPRIKLAQVVAGNEAPNALFAFVTELTLTVNNNVSPDKAVGVLGAFDATAGQFVVNGSITAYFSDIAAVQAVRNNADVTLDIALVVSNGGVVFDVPLLALGDARATIEKDRPITIPLSADAATGAKIDPNLDHTLMVVFFDHLPDLANPTS